MSDLLKPEWIAVIFAVVTAWGGALIACATVPNLRKFVRPLLLTAGGILTIGTCFVLVGLSATGASIDSDSGEPSIEVTIDSESDVNETGTGGSFDLSLLVADAEGGESEGYTLRTADDGGSEAHILLGSGDTQLNLDDCMARVDIADAAGNVIDSIEGNCASEFASYTIAPGSYKVTAQATVGNCQAVAVSNLEITAAEYDEA